MKKTDIIILTGFLGSGKTTLLKQLLANDLEQGKKIAVVMNEIGKISIDSNEIQEDVRLKELLNGCVCCSMKDQLEIQLLSLIQQNELDIIYIETTGVANTIDVIDACTSSLTVEKMLLSGVITTLDASRWFSKDTLSPAYRLLLHQQVMYSDIVLLNRLNQLNTAQGELVLKELKSINPKIITEYSIDALVSNISHQSKQSSSIPISASSSLKIKTIVYEMTKPISKQKFEHFLRNAPSSLLRLKGYIQFTKDPTLYNVQYANGFVTYEKELMKLPMRLVLIGENIDETELVSELDQLS
ncbi:GTP-binding protein [Bacillus sp. RG28]|uniref:GTP-binding protein n=1 Tax=Gottfriedia endophytica TaxID=2820819 RepID=A0A940NSC2_9BACI|nr:GTP-binding protein [Gottfriedia endophytica]MBP0725921.1 GTP-binding protein [Gottfriedia endophytica]